MDFSRNCEVKNMTEMASYSFAARSVSIEVYALNIQQSFYFVWFFFKVNFIRNYFIYLVLEWNKNMYGMDFFGWLVLHFGKRRPRVRELLLLPLWIKISPATHCYFFAMNLVDLIVPFIELPRICSTDSSEKSTFDDLLRQFTHDRALNWIKLIF